MEGTEKISAELMQGIQADIARDLFAALETMDEDAEYAAIADAITDELITMKRLDAVHREAAEATKNAAVVWPYLEGQWFSYFVAWYRYYTDVLGLELDSIWQIEEQIQFGCVYPLGRYVVISRRPECIHRNAAGQLHRDGGPAIRYADGFSVFALNGVRVPEWLACTPEGEIDPVKFAEIENAEIRREFVRKVGVERIASSCGAEVKDKQGNYELVLVDLGGRTGKVPYLKMLNPSIGVWHLEGVAPGITTVAEALKWRNGGPLTPSQLT